MADRNDDADDVDADRDPDDDGAADNRTDADDRDRSDDTEDDDYEVGSEDDPAFGDDWSAPSKSDHRKMVRTIAQQKAAQKRLKARLNRALDQAEARDSDADDSHDRRSRRRDVDNDRDRGRDDRDRGRRNDRDRDDDRDDSRRPERSVPEVDVARGYYAAALADAGFVGSDRERAAIIAELRPRDFEKLRSGRYDFGDVIDDLRDEEPELFDKPNRGARRGRDDDGDGERPTRRAVRSRRRRDSSDGERPRRDSTDALLGQLGLGTGG